MVAPLLAAVALAVPVHTYDGRFYSPAHSLTARIACTKPTTGLVAGWAGVGDQNIGWAQAGVYAVADGPHAYYEQSPPYALDARPEQTATVTLTRIRFGWRVTLNGRSRDVVSVYRSVWVGIERIDSSDGGCTIAVTTR